MSLENRRMLLLIDHSMLYGLFKYCFTDLRTDGDLTLNGNDGVGGTIPTEYGLFDDLIQLYELSLDFREAGNSN